jgi:hypothetical protein
MKYVCNNIALDSCKVGNKLARVLQIFMSEQSDPVSDPEPARLFRIRIGIRPGQKVPDLSFPLRYFVADLSFPDVITICIHC